MVLKNGPLIVSYSGVVLVNYGAPFVTCTLLLTEANFVQQKSLLSDKSNFVYDKIIFVRRKLILSDKSWFCQTKVDFVRQK